MQDIETRTTKKVIRRFLPILVVSFILCFLDRVNVGFATLTMSKDLGFSNTVFGLGAGIFFVAYFLFEVPSNIILEKVGARIWIARIMITWGILSAATAFVWDEWSFYTIRFLLGAAEAGFFPGIAFYFTLWLPSRHRGKVNSIFLASMPVASVIGSPISGWLLSLDGMWGLHGWQLLFIIEGLPSVFVAFVVIYLLRDTPEKAEWLDADEKAWLANELRRERESVTALVPHGVLNVMKSPIILLLCVVYFGVTAFNYGISFFLPQIVRDFGLSFVQTGFVAAIPPMCGAIGMVLWGRHSDKHNERRLHVLLPLSLAAIGLGSATLVSAPVLKLAFLSLAAVGVFSTVPVFWVLLPSLLSAGAVAVAFAVVNSVGNLSGFVAPYVVGALKDATGSVNPGLQAISLFGFVAVALLAGIIRYQQSVSRTGDRPATAKPAVS